MGKSAKPIPVTKEEMKLRVGRIARHCGDGGFEIYTIMKSEPRLRLLSSREAGEESIRLEVKRRILAAFANKFGSSEAQFESGDYMSENEKKLYYFETGGGFDPFDILDAGERPHLSANEAANITGFAFMVRWDDETVWLYQHVWPTALLRKTNKNLFARIVSRNEKDVFEGINEPIVGIATRVDILVLDGHIVTDNLKLLQNQFRFQNYIRSRSEGVINTIRECGLVANPDKLTEYVRRQNGKIAYAKKMMRVSESLVLSMDADELRGRVQSSQRWRDAFEWDGNGLLLKTYKQVELLIDLLDERYVRSEITGEEYDAKVKRLAQSA